MKQFVKVIKIDEKGKTSLETGKYDYCIINANSFEEANSLLIDQLIIRRSIQCEYFSENSKYRQYLGNIVKFIPSTEEEFETFRRKCIYAKEHSKVKNNCI